MSVSYGEVHFIDEIIKHENVTVLQGKSVRVNGRLDQHNCAECTAVVTDPQSNSSLRLDTRLIEPFDARHGSLFQVIGEIECGGTNHLVLKARVVRCVDGMDLIMYRRVVDTQRRYLALRGES